MDLVPDTGDDLDYDSSNEGLDLFMDDDEPAEPGDSGSKKGYLCHCPIIGGYKIQLCFIAMPFKFVLDTVFYTIFSATINTLFCSRRITVEPTTFLLCDIIIGVVILESSYHSLVLYCGRVLINTAHTII